TVLHCRRGRAARGREAVPRAAVRQLAASRQCVIARAVPRLEQTNSEVLKQEQTELTESLLKISISSVASWEEVARYFFSRPTVQSSMLHTLTRSSSVPRRLS